MFATLLATCGVRSPYRAPLSKAHTSFSCKQELCPRQLFLESLQVEIRLLVGTDSLSKNPLLAHPEDLDYNLQVMYSHNTKI